eukprot:gene25547-32017_t
MPPTLLSATFALSGLQVYVQFDSATNMPFNASSFPCAQLMAFNGAKLATCAWISNSQLLVTLSSTPPYLPAGEPMRTLPNLVKAACGGGSTLCSSYKFANASSVFVTASPDAMPPVVALTTASVISSCDDIVLDASGSTGFGGRAWSSVLWSVTSSSASTSSLASMSAMLNKNFTNPFLTATIPNRYLTASAVYTISLQLVNFIGVSAVRSVTVTVSSSALVPRVSIYGLSSTVSSRWKPFVYVWSVYKAADLVTTLQSTSRDPRNFRLEAFALDVSATYTFQLAAYIYNRSELNPVSYYARTSIEIGRSGVIAILSGGDTRILSTQASSVFDASESYDLDFPDSSSSNGGLLAVLPTDGTALSTLFTFTTSQWVDDPADYPIVYTIAYYPLTVTSMTTIKAKDQTPRVQTMLGQGLSSTNFRSTGIAIAADVYGGTANTTTPQCHRLCDNQSSAMQHGVTYLRAVRCGLSRSERAF